MSFIDKIDKASDWIARHIFATALYLGLSVTIDVRWVIEAGRSGAAGWLTLRAGLYVASTIYFLRIYLAKSARAPRPASTTTLIIEIDPAKAAEILQAIARAGEVKAR